MEYLSACPICHGHDLTPYLSCQDHSVSHETFTLERCGQCGFVMTNPRPSAFDLPRYYESDTYISHSDRPASLVDYIYRISRRFTLRWKYHLVQNHSLTKPANILDFGCGTGAFLVECKEHKMQIAGVEPSAIAREIAVRNTNAPISEDFSGVSGDYDAITLWHVLEHVPTLHQTIEALKNHLTKSGIMFIAVPNLKSLDAKKYLDHWAAYDVPRHLWHFSKDTMKKTLDSHDLTLIATIPMRLDSYYVSLLSEKYKNGNKGLTNTAKALLRGWQSNKQARKTNEYSSLIYIVRK